MPYYHASPIGNLQVLNPAQTKYFGKPAQVYMTTLRPMALFYLIKNFEYTYGYTKEGKIYYEEYYPDALKNLYQGKGGFLYTCEEGEYQHTQIPNECVSKYAVRILDCKPIKDAYEEILKEEKAGNLFIRNFHDLTEKDLTRIKKFAIETIIEKELWKTDSPFSEYMKEHYPDSFEEVIKTKAL